MLQSRLFVTTLVLAAASSSAVAAELTDAPESGGIDVHGFASQGALLSTGNNYLAKSKDGSFEMAEVGINFTKQLTDDLRFGLQLFSRDLGPIGNYSAKIDWFYLDYHWSDKLGFRAGRIKTPFGLYNEVNDIDSARVPILLPQSTYPLTSRDFLLAQTGIELYGHLDGGVAGRLDYVAYAGTNYIDTTSTAGSPYQILSFDTPYVAGGRLMWMTPIDGLRAGYSVQKLKLHTDLLSTTGPMPGLLSIDIPATLQLASVEYVHNDLTLAAEYGRWNVGFETSKPVMGVAPGSTTSEMFYVMATYRVNDWFYPGAYYSHHAPNVDKYSTFDPFKEHLRSDIQRDLSVTARFDINSHWLVKLEVHGMRGTAYLSGALNDNRPKDKLESDWLLFMAKTTAYF